MKKKKKNGAQSGSGENRETEKRGGAGTTREQRTARQEKQTRREGTESGEAGGQRGKQHTVPWPRAAGAGNQRKPETKGAHKIKGGKIGQKPQAGGGEERTTKRQGPRHQGPETKETKGQRGHAEEEEEETKVEYRGGAEGKQWEGK